MATQDVLVFGLLVSDFPASDLLASDFPASDCWFLPRWFSPGTSVCCVVSLRRGRRNFRSREIGAGEPDQALAKLFAQHPCAYLLDRTLGEFAELKRTEGDADEPRDRQPEIAEHVAHLAVLALADRQSEPKIRALHAVERRFDRPVMDAVDCYSGAQFVELCLGCRSVRADAVTPQPAGRRQFEHPRQAAIIGEENKPLGIEIEPSNADEAGQMLGQPLEYGRPAARVGVRGHQPARLMVEEEPRAFALRQRLAVDADAVGRGHVARGRCDHRAVDRDAAGGDPLLRLAARGEAGAGDDLGDALAGFVAVLDPVRHDASFWSGPALCRASTSLYTAMDRGEQRRGWPEPARQ